MKGILPGILALVLLGTARADDKGQDKPATPADQYKALVKEFYELTHVFSFTARTEEERKQAVARMNELRLASLALAEKNPRDEVALDAMTQAITLELWLENNTAHPGWGKDSAGARAVELLLRD